MERDPPAWCRFNVIVDWRGGKVVSPVCPGGAGDEFGEKVGSGSIHGGLVIGRSGEESVQLLDLGNGHVGGRHLTWRRIGAGRE